MEKEQWTYREWVTSSEIVITIVHNSIVDTNLIWFGFYKWIPLEHMQIENHLYPGSSQSITFDHSLTLSFSASLPQNFIREK